VTGCERCTKPDYASELNSLVCCSFLFCFDPKLGQVTDQCNQKFCKIPPTVRHRWGNSVVAVIDTGMDYTHQDRVPNVWVNPGENPSNGIDDDSDG